MSVRFFLRRWSPAWAILLGACGGAAGSDPNLVLREYGRALEESRADDAYRYLSDDARRGISIDAFRKLIKDNPEEAREIGHALGRGAPTPPIITSTITSRTGDELHLVLEKGRWRVDETAVDLYAQDTPKHAIQAFVRALEHKRYDVAFRFVPEAHREGLTPEKLQAAWQGDDREAMDRVVASLKQALPYAAIEETGDHATLPYGAGTMQLVREHGVWTIEDFD